MLFIYGGNDSSYQYNWYGKAFSVTGRGGPRYTTVIKTTTKNIDECKGRCGYIQRQTTTSKTNIMTKIMVTVNSKSTHKHKDKCETILNAMIQTTAKSTPTSKTNATVNEYTYTMGNAKAKMKTKTQANARST